MGKKIVIVNKKTDDNEKKTNAVKNDENINTVDNEGMSDMEEESFEQLYEQSLTEFKQGEVVKGKIASIATDEVFVDIGYKSEGKIDRNEFEDEIKVGDEVSVMVINMEDHDGNIVVSKRKADVIVGREIIKENFDNDKAVKGKIVREIKGGFIVYTSGIEAFLPGSQVDLRRSSSPQDYVGKTFDFKISKYEFGKSDNIVLSRRAYLEKELGIKKEDLFKRLKEGDRVTGKIKSVLDYGAFIDIEGTVDGFLHLKDVSWVHIKNCNEALSEGNEVECLILKLDTGNQKINLGLKQLSEDPWDKFVKENNVNDVLNGEVVRLLDFGAFIAFPGGVEGLVHVKEMSWTKRVNHPKEVLKAGDPVQVMIMSMDTENKKLSLSLKQVLDNPWDSINDKYPKGRKIKGTIKNITNFGVFIELDDNLVGLLHQSDLDWTKKTANPKNNEQFKTGNEIDVVVLGTDKKEKTISLGLKQLLENPWEIFKANHPKGSIINGKITKVMDSGIVIALDKNIDGFLHHSEMLKKKEEKVEDLYKLGDEVKALIKNIDLDKNKIALSIREYEKRQEQKTIDQYIVKENNTGGETMTLGDMINLNSMKG